MSAAGDEAKIPGGEAAVAAAQSEMCDRLDWCDSRERYGYGFGFFRSSPPPSATVAAATSSWASRVLPPAASAMAR
jgi:hypothetical protein